MRSMSFSGTRRSPTFLLSLSTITGRAGSKRRSASQTLDSNCFCPGCGLPGTRPSTEPRWFASSSRSSTCTPSSVSRCSSRLLPEPVTPQTTRRSKRCGKLLQRGDDRAPVLAVAALEQVHTEADGRQHGGQRTAALPAAPAVDQRRPVLGLVHRFALDVRSDVARRQHRAALARREGRDLLVLGADQRAFGVVQRRPVDRAGQAVLGVLAFRARVDHRVELGEPGECLIGGER